MQTSMRNLRIIIALVAYFLVPPPRRITMYLYRGMGYGALFTVLFLVSSGVVFACNCTPLPVSLELKRSDVVFSGRAVGITRGITSEKAIDITDQKSTLYFRFTVIRSWKGVEAEEITVATDFLGKCRIYFQLGEEYLVYATRSDKVESFFTDHCTRTRPLATAEDDTYELANLAGPANVRPASGSGKTAADAGVRYMDVSLDRWDNLYISGRLVSGNGNGRLVEGGTPEPGASPGYPMPVSLDWMGILYLADWHNERIWRVDTSGFVTTLGSPMDGFWAGGKLYIADWKNGRIQKIDFAEGIITTVAEAKAEGHGLRERGRPADAGLNSPSVVFVDESGNLYTANGPDHHSLGVYATPTSVRLPVSNR